jgi:hypothetical protein
MKEQDHSVDERHPGLFQPDLLLPSQFHDRFRRRQQLDGERRLMLAVLEDAVEMYRKHCGPRPGRNRQLFLDAEEWIENDDRTWMFSFLNLCDILDLDGEYIRRGLHALKQRAAGTPPRRESVTVFDEEPELRRASGA